VTAETAASIKKSLGLTVKIACLCIILFQYAKSFSTPALSSVAAAFPDISPLMVKQIEAIPSLMAIFGAFSVGILERFMKKKTMLWIAMLATLIGGMAAGFMPETIAGFYGILACRVVLGFGRGMIFPMASSFIADLFTGKTRDSLMSYKTAVGGLGGALFQIIGGTLAVLSWRYAFIGYAFIIPIIIMIAFWVPEPDVRPIPAKSGKKQLSGAAFLIIALAFIYNFFQFSIFIDMSLVVSATGLGTTALSGTIMSTLTLATAAGAILYGFFIKGPLGGFDIPISMLLCGIGFLILVNFVSVPMYYVAVIIFGFGFGIFNPALILQCVKVVPKESATLSLSILAAMQNFGQYLCAYVLAFLAGVLGITVTVNALSDFAIAGPATLIFAVVMFVLILIVKSKNRSLIAGVYEEKEVSKSSSGQE
jgi:MFS family permease